jgi:hypothetical protein
MELPPRLVEIVFKPIDLFAEHLALAPIPIAIAIRALVLAPQSLDLALLPLEFSDQFFASGRVPLRVHAPVMARSKNLYKYKRTHHGCRRRSATAITR